VGPSVDASVHRIFAELMKYALRDDLATVDVAYSERDDIFAYRGETGSTSYSVTSRGEPARRST